MTISLTVILLNNLKMSPFPSVRPGSDSKADKPKPLISVCLLLFTNVFVNCLLYVVYIYIK